VAKHIQHNWSYENACLSWEGSYFQEVHIFWTKKVIYRTTLFCTTIDHPYERTYLCTLQRGHQFVQYLKHEDIILAYAYVNKEDDFNLKRVTICVVYTVVRDIHVGVHGGHEIHNNVKVMSKEVKEKLSKLVLVDNPNT
jgi:hypothetical protein